MPLLSGAEELAPGLVSRPVFGGRWVEPTSCLATSWSSAPARRLPCSFPTRSFRSFAIPTRGSARWTRCSSRRDSGLHPGQLLLRVELPLATRKIMAGVRTSEVISIDVATLPALIGAGGFREPIVTGFSAQRRRSSPLGRRSGGATPVPGRLSPRPRRAPPHCSRARLMTTRATDSPGSGNPNGSPRPRPPAGCRAPGSRRRREACARGA